MAASWSPTTSRSRPPGLLALPPLAVVLIALSFATRGETAESYCARWYGPEGTGTPAFAVKDGLFDDLASCIDWYEAAAAADAGPIGRP